MGWVLRSLAVVVAVVGTAAPVLGAGGTVRVRATAVVEDAKVRLGDVATMSGLGRDGETLAEVVLVEALPESGARVKAEQILFAIASQRGAAAANTVMIAGSSDCLVVLKGQESRLPVLAEGRDEAKQGKAVRGSEAKLETKVEAKAAEAKPEGQGAAKGEVRPTLGQLLIERLYQDLSAERDELRVEFETISAFLDTPTPPGQRWQFRPTVRGLGTVQWEAQLLEGTRTVSKLSVMGKVTRRQRVLFAAGTIARGDLVTAAQVREEEAWLDRKMPTLAARAQDVVGLEAVRGIASGTMLDTRDLRAAEMAGRGEAVTVFATSGNLVVKGSARAMEAGKLHDSIKVRSDATGELYQVTLIGKRRGVVGPAVDEATEKRLREMP